MRIFHRGSPEFTNCSSKSPKWIIYFFRPASRSRASDRAYVQCMIRVKVTLGLTDPSLATTLTVEVVSAGLPMCVAPQPVQRPNPSPAARTDDSNLNPFRRLRPRQQNPTAIADPGNHGLESCGRPAICVEVVTLRRTEAVVPAGVTVAGEKLQEAPAGRPEQVSETGETNPSCGVT